MQIAVIGAGMAGASCARILADAGHSLTVFEKSRGLGGRLATRRGEGWQADHGAPSFDARTTDFARQLQAWQQRGVVERWLAADGEPSADRYVGVPRQNAPVAALLEGIALQRETRVLEALRQPEGSWRLGLAGGGAAGPFDALVLAVPAPQVLDCVPALPAAWRDEVAAAALTPCWSVMLQYSADWGVAGTMAFQADAQVACSIDDRSKPGRTGQPCWVLQSTAAWASAHLECSPDDVAAQFDAWAQAQGAPAASGRTAHRWRFAQSRHAVAGGQLYDPALQLGLCGDWLAGGRVEGAWHSGRALAVAMQEALA